MKMTINRSFYIRIAAIVVVILIGVWMFFIGKQHTILIDNNKTGDIKALDEVYVQIDKQPEMVLYSRMRDQFVVTGQSHTLKITYVDENWNEVTIEKKLDIPLGENMMLLSIPYLVANQDSPQEEWLTHFESLAVSVDTGASEEIVTDETAAFADF